jgi:hypothetical protein
MATINPNDLNIKIQQIQDRINQLFGDEKTYYESNLRALQAQNAELEKFELLYRDVVNASNDLNRELIDTALYFRRSVAELSKQNTELGNAKNALKSISKIASEVVYENSQNVLIEEKTLQELEKKAKLQFDSLKISIQSGDIQGAELRALELAAQEQQNFFNTLTEIRKKQSEVKKDAGIKIFTGLEAISEAIPGLGKFTSMFKDASKASQEQALYNQRIFGTTKNLSIEEQKSLNNRLDKYKQLVDQGLNINDALKQAGVSAQQVKFGKLPGTESISALRAGINSLGPALAKALGPAIIIKELVDALKKSDQAVGDMAKGLNMSYNEALNMKQELTAAANSSGNIFVTSKGMAESLLAINKTLGTNVMLNKEDLTTFTKLRETAGLTNEELMGIQSLSLANGKSLKNNTGEIMAQAKMSSVRNGIALNEKEILKGIKDISAATTLTLGKNPKALADAVVQAKSLGMEIKQIEQIAQSLLNFEESISSELEAELLTGRQLNLEQARYYALTGDVANLAKELSTQLGSAEEFGKLNVIQQEALAKSMGMGREELAKTLFVQEQLKGATGEDAKIRERRLNQLIAEKGLAEAQRILAEEGITGLENQASMQDRFNASAEKLREIFVTVVEALMPLIDIFAEVLKLVGAIIKVLDPILQFTSTGFSFIADLLSASTYKTGEFKNTNASVIRTEDSFQKNWAQPLGSDSKGFNVSRFLNKAGDLNSPAMGRTVVSTKEGGLFELSSNDDLVAAPGISEIFSSLNKSNNSPPLSINLSSLESKLDKLEQTNALLTQLVRKDTSVYMDGAKVGKSIALAGSNLG